MVKQTNQIHISQIRSKHRALQIVVVAIFLFRSSSELQQNTIPDALFITIPAEFFVSSFILGIGIIFISFWFLVQVISLLWLHWLKWSIQSPFHQTNILCMSVGDGDSGRLFHFHFVFRFRFWIPLDLLSTCAILIAFWSVRLVRHFLSFFQVFFLLQKLDSGFAISSNVE